MISHSTPFPARGCIIELKWVSGFEIQWFLLEIKKKKKQLLDFKTNIYFVEFQKYPVIFQIWDSI